MVGSLILDICGNAVKNLDLPLYFGGKGHLKNHIPTLAKVLSR